MRLSGGQAVVEILRRNGVRRAYGVPGESFLPILDALRDTRDLDFVLARHEGGAAMMAEAEAKATGRPGVCLVTRGPGVSNAASGLHVAAQDSTPLVLLMGQVARGQRLREAFQEIDVAATFGAQAKWAAEVGDPSRLPELLTRALATALSGRPGPVVLALPEDVLSAEIQITLPPPAQAVGAHPGPAEMERFAALLGAAERPVVVAGGEPWDAAACDGLVALAERWSVPVACAFRCQDRFPNDHPQYAGDVGLGINPALAARLRSADLLVALGPRLGDCTTQGYTLLDVPVPQVPLVHVHADPEELGRVYQPALAINARPTAFVEAWAALPPRPAPSGRSDHVRAANAEYRAWSDAPTDVPGGVNLGACIVALREELPADAFVSNGAGNYAAWLHRFYRHRAWRTQLAPTSGSMGYGLPAAIAAKLCHPEREAVAFAGDGCFQMTCQELGTVAQLGLRLVVIVVNNGSYGTIRMHQERHHPGRVSGTDLVNPDFCALARAYNLAAERVTRTDAFAAALARARSADTAALIEVVTDPRALTPTMRLPEAS